MRHCNGLTGGMWGYYFYDHIFEIWRRLKVYANHIEKTSVITINDILRNFILRERSCPLNYISATVKSHGDSLSLIPHHRVNPLICLYRLLFIVKSLEW